VRIEQGSLLKVLEGLEGGESVEPLPSMHEALGSILRTIKIITSSLVSSSDQRKHMAAFILNIFLHSLKKSS
jgi:hypothetical protein